MSKAYIQHNNNNNNNNNAEKLLKNCGIANKIIK